MVGIILDDLVELGFGQAFGRLFLGDAIQPGEPSPMVTNNQSQALVRELVRERCHREPSKSGATMSRRSTRSP